MATGLLLVNLGTPEAPTPGAVRRYLGEFLSDPRVLDMNPIGRALLLHLVILRFRPRKSAHAYRQIWDASRGSPLLYHSRDLAAAVAADLGPTWNVQLAMRYGSPSLGDALQSFRRESVNRIVVLPLFPHAAASSSGTAAARVMELATRNWDVPSLTVIPPFFDDAGFLDAFAAVGRPYLTQAQPDHVLFSYHGLPERHIRKSDASGDCLRSATCSDELGGTNCYRAQCFATSRYLATRLGINNYSTSFQSRLGRIPWIRPYTDDELSALASRGVKRLLVFCPAFVADCLETLEEIGMRARDAFLAAGGEALTLVPSLNAHPDWVKAVANLARRHGDAHSHLIQPHRLLSGAPK